MQCTFATTGTTFTSQPIWECLTCPLTNGEVLCAACLHTCHSKCETRLVSEGSRAYCDCGNRGPSKCQGLKPPPPPPAAANPPRVSSTPSPPPTSSSSSSAPPPSLDAIGHSLGRPRTLVSNASDSTPHQRVQSASGSLRRPVEKKNPATSAVANSLMKGALFSLPGSFASFSVAAPAPFTTAPTIPSQCTYLTTGATFATQPIYACYTCGLFGDYAVCYYCILRCHAHHKIAFISDNKRGYCDCGSRPAKPTTAPKQLTHNASSSSGTAGVNAPPCCAQHPLNYLEAKALSYLCTLAQTGTNFHLQRVFHCRDCGIRDDEICCASCAAVCHAGHAIDDRGEMRAYCDCSSNGLCQTLDIMSVVHARQSNHSSHSTTPSIFNLSRRSSLGSAPQLELTDMSNSNSAANSARQSRRTSLNGPLNVAHALNHNEPPPVPGDAPQDDPSDAGVQQAVRPLTPPLPRLFSPEPDPTNILPDVLTEKHIQEAASPERRRARAESIAAMAAAAKGATEQQPSSNGNSEATAATTATSDPAAAVASSSAELTAIVDAASVDTTTTASSLPASEAPPSPRKIRALIDSLPLNPSLHDFLAVLGFESLYLDVFNAHELTEIESLARGINEKELEVLVPKIGHRVKIKSALIALRQKMKLNHPSAFTSPAAGVVHATNQTTSALPELSLPPTSSATSNSSSSNGSIAIAGTSSLSAQNRRAAEQSCSIYKAVLQSMIQEGAIRARDEELLSNLRHQSSLSFSHHQSVLRDLGLDEEAFENLKRVGAEREKKEKPVTASDGAASVSHATTGGGLMGDVQANETGSPVTGATVVPECCICLSEPSNQVFIPCGHVVCCQNCAEHLIRASKEKSELQQSQTTTTNSDASFTYPSQQLFQFDRSPANPDMSPRLLGVTCVKCRAPVEHIYRTFM